MAYQVKNIIIGAAAVTYQQRILLNGLAHQPFQPFPEQPATFLHSMQMLHGVTLDSPVKVSRFLTSQTTVR